jgi:hypothetical protein
MDSPFIGELIVPFEYSALVSMIPPEKASVATTLLEVKRILELIKAESSNPSAMIVRAFLILILREKYCSRGSLIYRFEHFPKPVACAWF